MDASINIACEPSPELDYKFGPPVLVGTLEDEAGNILTDEAGNQIIGQ